MRTWGSRSFQVYEELDSRLQWVFDRVLRDVADVSLIEGHRNAERQNKMFDEGRSKLRWPDGNHNAYPSLAVDFQPYPTPKHDTVLWASLAYVAGAAIQIAKQKGITLRWGGDWNRNGQISDQTFHDLFHIEVV
jgi:peptidoglycan L-alanyl-D-glutamate endopeptidase CwlK